MSKIRSTKQLHRHLQNPRGGWRTGKVTRVANAGVANGGDERRLANAGVAMEMPRALNADLWREGTVRVNCLTASAGLAAYAMVLNAEAMADMF